MLKAGQLISDFILMQQMSLTLKDTVVFSAKHIKTNTYVAIKIFNTSPPALCEHFLRETQILQKLNHPNIVRYLDSGKTSDFAYIVTEFLEGVTLNRITPKEVGLTFKTLWPLIQQIAQGLHAIHQSQIVHFDIKPSNVLLTHQDSHPPLIKIIDFDIAEDIKERYVTDEKKTWGTPGYIAPERILKKNGADIRSDIYSFGALLVFLLTGQKAFTGDTAEQILAKQLNQLPDRMKSSYLGASPQLQEIITKAMQKNPANRFQNALKMMEALKVYANNANQRLKLKVS